MSRLLISSLVVVCLLGHPRAGAAQQVTAGLKGGISAARLPGVVDAVDAAVDEEVRWGATAGVFVTARLTDLVAVQPEVLYAMKGSTLVSDALATTITFDARYLEVPLLLRLGRSSQRGYLLAGPAFAFRLAAESRETFGGVTQTDDLSNQAKRVDIGVALGAGATFGRFLVEGRWTEGLRDAESGDRFTTAVRHRVLAVLAGVRF